MTFWSDQHKWVEDVEIEEAPRSAESKAGGQWLIDLLSSFSKKTKYPTQKIAGLTSLQKELLGYLEQDQKGSRARIGLADDEVKRTLEGGYDPRTSDFYQGLRAEAGKLSSEGKAAIRKGRGGLSLNAPTSPQESSLDKQSDTQLTKLLGGLYERERGRQLNTAVGTPGYEAGRLDATGRAMGVADIERQIEQQKQDALYRTALQELLHPYEQQSNIALAMMNYQPDYAVTGGGLTDQGFMTTLGTQFASQFAGSRQNTQSQTQSGSSKYNSSGRSQGNWEASDWQRK